MHALHQFLLVITLTCLGQKAFGSEIINGEKAQKKSLLYMASVQNDGKHECGGFLVSKEFVLTAAHCDKKDAIMSVVLGTHNIKSVHEKTMRYSVRKCKHTSFVNSTSGNDIMLLKLSRKATLGKTIKLPKQDKAIKANTMCLVAGWGLTKTNGNIVDELRVVNVPTIDGTVCRKAWNQVSRAVVLPDNVICAGGYGNDKGACQGDSGGPLVCNGKAVGIVSFNYKKNCTYPNLPNIYTEISKFLPWIKKILKKKECVV